ncbi:MAG: hypothetical protein RMZ69_15005 [Nostoc sp. ChiQUE01a]|nr:hypothetical protein [Nostoc sp. ChiQUE01a]
MRFQVPVPSLSTAEDTGITGFYWSITYISENIHALFNPITVDPGIIKMRLPTASAQSFGSISSS